MGAANISVTLRFLIGLSVFLFFQFQGRTAYDLTDDQFHFVQVSVLSYIVLQVLHGISQSISKSRETDIWVRARYVADIALATTLIFWTGREQSLFTTLYFIPIVESSFVFGLSGVIATAASSVALFLFLMLMPRGGPVQWFTGINHILAFVTIGLMSGVLRMRLQAARRTIRNLESVNNAIINNISSGIILFDSRQTMLTINPAGAAILGIPNPTTLEFLSRLKSPLSFKETSPEERPILHYQHPAKGIRDLGYNVSKFADPMNEDQEATLFSFQDLTRIHEIQQQLFTSKKLAAIGQLAASIAHEIRNPLASISGCVEILERNVGKDDESQKLISIVLKETERLNRLIGEFLNYVGKDQLTKTHADIRMLIEETIESIKFRKDYPPAVQMEVSLPKAPVKSMVDVHKIKQALLNLLLNGIQAIQGSGKISIQLQSHPQHARIVIKDTGSGISPENVDRIFDPFFTTKSTGTGLGLAMTQKIIEQHDGKISVKSQLGHGTEFAIELPHVRNA